jgi:hypothetical protein
MMDQMMMMMMMMMAMMGVPGWRAATACPVAMTASTPWPAQRGAPNSTPPSTPQGALAPRLTGMTSPLAPGLPSMGG